MQGIVKRFGSLIANDHVDLSVRRGEVHALLGENGAGKSTLMNMLYGLLHPDSGVIEVSGRPVKFSGPRDAIAAGIGMVHQHFMLVAPFTVTENIVLGTEPTNGPALDLKRARADVMEISARYSLAVDPDARIQDISVGMQQRVEIIKALYRGADILILDEPTAVLTPQEIDELMGIISGLCGQGKSVIIITHKLMEIKKCAQRCTVIRRGHMVGTVDVADVSEAQLAEMMVGRTVMMQQNKGPASPGEPVLTIRGLHALDARRLPALRGLSLDVHRGEIVGIAGVDGNGQKELCELLAGLIAPTSGNVILSGKDVTRRAPWQMIDAGMGCIPQDRQRRGLVLPFTVADNFILEKRKQAPFSKRGLLNQTAIREHAEFLVEHFDVRPRDVNHIAGQLSGGNQQKAVIARIIGNDPRLLLAVQPTRGLDVGAIEFVHKALIAQRDVRRAVLLVSLDLDEIMSLSDRILVIYEGVIVGEVAARDANAHKLGLMMAGGRAHA